MERERKREREGGETRDGWPENGGRRRMKRDEDIEKVGEEERKRNRNGLIETKSNLDGRKTNVFMDEDEFYIG